MAHRPHWRVQKYPQDLRGKQCFVQKFRSVASQRVKRELKAEKPEDPAKEDFTFEGWYSDKNLSVSYVFNESVTKSFTLYAKWTEKQQRPINRHSRLSRQSLLLRNGKIRLQMLTETLITQVRLCGHSRMVL